MFSAEWNFRKKNSWYTCVVNVDQKKQPEEILHEYHYLSAKRRFDVTLKQYLKFNWLLNTKLRCMINVHQLYFNYVMKI